MVYNLVDRATTLSDKKFHSKNLSFVKKILELNDYPSDFIKKFTHKRISFLKRTNFLKNKPPKPKLTKVFNKFRIKIPYKAGFYDEVVKSCKKFKIDVIPSLSQDLKNVIRKGKDCTKKLDNTGVVYGLYCKNCPAVYVGETKRKLGQRVCEHVRDVRTKKDTVVSEHCSVSSHDMEWDNVTILDRESDWKPRLISEMLHIHLQKSPTLNRKEDTQKLSHSYMRVLDALRT